MRKILYILLTLSLLFILFPTQTEAKTINDYKNDLKKLEEKAAANKEAQNNKKIEINDTNNKIEDTQNQIKQAEKDIKKAQEEIVRLNGEIEDKDKEIKDLVKFNQISSGENSYLEFIFGAKSLTDFVYRASIVEQLSKYNDETINEMNNLIKENEQAQIDLKNSQEELAKLQEELKDKLETQIDSLTEIAEDAIDIDTQIEEMRQTIKTYEKMGCKPNQELSTCSDVPVGTGFSRPTATGIITSGFGYRNTGIAGASTYHSAVDIGVGVGTPVYSTAPGKVVYTGYNGSMGNYVRINHTINGRNYNSVYMHNSGINVSPGQVVTKNTVIAYSGNTGISSGPHLHFGLAYGHFTSYSAFTSNAFDPRSVIYFPSGYWYSRT